MRAGQHGSVVHRLFDIGLVAKLLDGGLELLTGSLLLLFKASQINHWFEDFIRHEIDLNPARLSTEVIIHAVHPLSPGTRIFAALLLLSHGMVKIGVVVALLRKQRWAYPLAVLIFALFAVAQLVRYASTRSVWLLSLTIVDLMVIALTWMEFMRTRPARRSDRSPRLPARCPASVPAAVVHKRRSGSPRRWLAR